MNNLKIITKNKNRLWQWYKFYFCKMYFLVLKEFKCGIEAIKEFKKPYLFQEFTFQKELPFQVEKIILISKKDIIDQNSLGVKFVLCFKGCEF